MLYNKHLSTFKDVIIHFEDVKAILMPLLNFHILSITKKVISLYCKYCFKDHNKVAEALWLYFIAYIPEFLPEINGGKYIESLGTHSLLKYYNNKTF